MFLVAEVAESAEQHPFCFRFLTATVVMKGHQWRHNQRRESVPRLYADVCEVDLWALSTCTPVLAPTIWNCLWSWLAATECLWGISHYIISALSQLSISSCGPGKADIKKCWQSTKLIILASSFLASVFAWAYFTIPAYWTTCHYPHQHKRWLPHSKLKSQAVQTIWRYLVTLVASSLLAE